MKKLLTVIIVVSLLGLFVFVGSLTAKKQKDFVSIKDGVLTYSSGHYLEGEVLELGYDIFGYNYQGHISNGSYANAYLGRYGFPPYEGDDESYLAENPEAENTWVWPYRNDWLMMKWSDSWLSNKDRDEDGVLDRYYGHNSYIGSGAWLTNHQKGTYVDDNGRNQHWEYFVKIVAASADAYTEDGFWHTADGEEIGEVIWGSFAIVQSIYNDSGTGEHGVEYLSPVGPGLGKW